VTGNDPVVVGGLVAVVGVFREVNETSPGLHPCALLLQGQQ
jgi:hypothetical protein